MFITGFGVADESMVTALRVPFTLKSFVGVVVLMPTLPLAILSLIQICNKFFNILSILFIVEISSLPIFLFNLLLSIALI